MLLVLDVGNTNIKIGLFQGDDLYGSWRISVKTQRTSDEYYAVFMELFSAVKIKKDDISGVIISSVVPTLNYTIEHTFDYYFNIKPIMVSSALKTGGLSFNYINKEELGADRIVNAVSVYHLYMKKDLPAIIVDLGTASTFGVIDANGCFLGGAIAPGLKSSVDALSSNAARLKMIEIQKPKHVIGRSTEENMQSGAIYGFSGLVKRIVEEFKAELGTEKAVVIGTGGLTELIQDKDLFDVVDRALTLKGLKILYSLNT